MKASRMILAAFVVMMMAGAAMATTYTYQPSDPDLGDLDHSRAYLWGIQPNIAVGEVVTEASIKFKYLRNWDNQPNDLWITLIDAATVGTTVFTDNESPSNYFGAMGLEIAHYEDLSSSPLTRTYTFDAAERVALNNYIADNNFGLGIDPDCHFYNCGIELTLVTEPGGGGEVPEPVAGTILLGGLGVLAARRKRS